MQHWDLVVVGGGITGWAAAATAAGAGTGRTLVIDRGGGGRSSTDLREGFALNRGAHALYLKGPGMSVLSRLGVAPSGAAPPLHGALGSIGGRTGLLPLSPGTLLRSRILDPRAKAELARLLSSLARQRSRDLAGHRDLAGRSTDEWLDSLGLRAAAVLTVRALIRLSSYSSDHAALSADAAIHQLRVAMGGVSYLHGGWETLSRQLRDVALGRGAGERRAGVAALQPDGDRIVVRCADGDILARTVILATGSHHSDSSLLGHRPTRWQDLGPPAEASCLDLGFTQPAGVGVLLGLDRPLYAIRHAPPARLAPPGGSVVHAVRYRSPDETWSPAEGRGELEAHVRAAGGDPELAAVARYLHRIPVTSCIPTPERDGLRGRPGVGSTGIPGVLVAGDWVGPVGMLADAALSSAEAAGLSAAARLDRSRPLPSRIDQTLTRGTRR